MQTGDKARQGLSGGVKTLLIVLGLFLLTAGATVVELAVKAHKHRPLLGSVVSLAILNINVLLLAILLLLIGRQLVKFYFERRRSPFGAGFRSKLITAFIGLSIVPAGILFVVAISLLTGGVKYWFGPRVEKTVQNSFDLAEDYNKDKMDGAKRAAQAIAARLEAGEPEDGQLQEYAHRARAEYGLDMVEIYGTGKRAIAVSASKGSSWARADRAFVSKPRPGKPVSEASTHREGDVIRGAAVYGRGAGVVVASSILSPSAAKNITEITRFYEEYKSLRTFKYPLSESYMLSFILITLVIVFAAIWFGLYISKGITVPISSLAEATHRISRGDYDFKIDIEGRDELGVLVESFKRMTEDLKASQARIKEANASLRESNDLLEERKRFIETVLENVNAGVLTIDRAGKISTMNRAAERITTLKPDETLGRGYREVFEFNQLDEIREQISELAEGGLAFVEKDIQITINRRTLNLRLFVSPLFDVDGGYLGILVVFDDMTDLIKAQRASAWREVARRIAHEVKNPLTPIQLSAQRLRKRYLDGTGDYEKIIGECTETIITQVESMKTLVDEFSKFARMPEAKPAPNDLHAIIDEVVSLYGGAHKDIAVLKEYDRSLPVASLDKEQMKRVFVNLFENAVTAMEGSGRIWISTVYDRDAGVARIEVADEGTGILPEDREKLFQPYFSKKKSGTGLGLAIVNRIISDHGGYIRVQGNQPKGARFIIELPVKG